MKTDATLHSLIMVGTAVYGRQRYRVAKAWARAGSLSQTATKSDSGKALSASAWIWPTLPQPIRAVRTRFIASPRKMDCAHPPEERQRLGHLFHWMPFYSTRRNRVNRAGITSAGITVQTRLRLRISGS